MADGWREWAAKLGCWPSDKSFAPEVCGTCAYMFKTNHYNEGECRRWAPAVGENDVRSGSCGLHPTWPLVDVTRHWCGEYERSAES
jgi:hypothetical protein